MQFPTGYTYVMRKQARLHGMGANEALSASPWWATAGGTGAFPHIGAQLNRLEAFLLPLVKDQWVYYLNVK